MTGFVEPEKIITMARMKPLIAPIRARNPVSGMNMAVPIAVVAMMIRSIPVFSVVPSIVIMLES